MFIFAHNKLAALKKNKESTVADKNIVNHRHYIELWAFSFVFKKKRNTLISHKNECRPHLNIFKDQKFL